MIAEAVSTRCSAIWHCMSAPHPAEEVRRLLFQHVPEIASGVIELKGIARKPGFHTIIAVHSPEPTVDPVGTCVGLRGIRVKTIVGLLSGEKMDIIRWSASPAGFIRNLLAPARLSEVKIDPANRRVTVFVSEDQVTLGNGLKGLRIQLCSQLLEQEIVVRAY